MKIELKETYGALREYEAIANGKRITKEERDALRKTHETDPHSLNYVNVNGATVFYSILYAKNS